MMDLSFVLLGIVMALLVGLWLGRSTQRAPQVRPSSSSYMQGLNFLLEDQPDKAVEEFVRALDVNPDTLETHLALGKLMRKQGHVNRAIRIHQNVLARPSLQTEHQHQVHLELARDFMAAGLLDRAELLLHEVIKESADLRSRAQRHLIEIYQDESEWQQAADVAASLLQSKFIKSQADEKKYVQRMISHFYCELAAQATEERNFPAARKYLAQAAATDKSGLRVAVLTATRHNIEGNFRQAIKLLGKVGVDSPVWFSSCLPTLLESFEGQYPQQGAAKLWEHLQSHTTPEPGVSDILFVVEKLLAEPRDSASERLAIEILARSLGVDLASQSSHAAFADTIDGFDSSAVTMPPLGRSDLALLNKLVALDLAAQTANVERADRAEQVGNVDQARPALQLQQRLVEELEAYLNARKMFRCNNCGFSGRQLHWRCPSCKRWDSCQPIGQSAS